MLDFFNFHAHFLFSVCNFFVHYSANPVPVTPSEHTHTRAFYRSSLFAEFRPILSGGSLLPLLFFISAQINALCSFSVSFSAHFISTPFAHYSSRTEHSEEFPGCVISICPLSCADASGHPRAHDLTPHRRGLALRRDFRTVAVPFFCFRFGFHFRLQSPHGQTKT